MARVVRCAFACFTVVPLLAVVCALAVPAAHQPAETVDAWPAITAEAKPWTRWWWLGSAVDPAHITRELESLARAGFGGVEVTPIYGVRGGEAAFIPYLSDRWVAMLEHTLGEARRLGLGVDLATGTGWPFGGPWVSDDAAARSMVVKTWTVKGGMRLEEPVRLQQTALVRALGNQVYEVQETRATDPRPQGTRDQPLTRGNVRPVQIDDLVQPVEANRNLQALALEQVKYPVPVPLVSLMAYSAGTALDLTDRVAAGGSLDWTAPSGDWALYAIFAGWHGKLVERAAPGGEGYVIDHFSRAAIRHYLAPFDRALAGRDLRGLRAFFNDSYEVDDATGQADWTPSLLEEFRTRRGYDLRRHIPALLGRADEDTSARVLTDYRETIADLLLDTFTTEWRAWAHGRSARVRNQAHGSPANLLDLYAASDIPETEGTELPRAVWASSAAHVAGRRLVSAEAATWLGEHFRSTLADVRANVDHYFLAGINHIVYHGTAYSPASEPWPGRLFYAAVEFNDRNPWWNNLGALNQYVSRVQSFLQAGDPDQDVLLYFPFADALARRGTGTLAHFGGANPPREGTAFEDAAAQMQARGFTYDYISDRQIAGTTVAASRLTTARGRQYSILVVPQSRSVPVATVERVLALARDGATVAFFNGWPSDVPGLNDLDARRAPAADPRRRVLQRCGSGGRERSAVGTGTCTARRQSRGAAGARRRLA